MKASISQINYIRKLDKNGAYDFEKMTMREASQLIDSLKDAKAKAKAEKERAAYLKARQGKPCIVYDLSGNEIKRFDSYEKAVEFTTMMHKTSAAGRYFVIEPIAK